MYNKLETLTNQEILDIMRKYDFNIQKEDNYIKISYLLKFNFNGYDLMVTIPYVTTEEELKIFIIKTFEKQKLYDDTTELNNFTDLKKESGEPFEELYFGNDYTGDLIVQMVEYRVKTLNMFRELTGKTNEKALEAYEKYFKHNMAEHELREKCEFEMVDGEVPEGCFDSVYAFCSYFDANFDEPEHFMFSQESSGKASYKGESLDIYFGYCLADVYNNIDIPATEDTFNYVPYDVGELKEYFEKSEEEVKEETESYGEESYDIKHLALLKLLHTEGLHGDEPIGYALETLLYNLEVESLDDLRLY